MPTRKQRRRELKSKRHEYEFVYVDGDGNELDEVPDDVVEKRPKERAERATKDAKGRQPQQRGGRAARTPPVPSWNRALKRGGLLGLVVFAMFSLTAKGNYASVLPLAVLYTIMFIPFTYMIDRFAYRRWQARQGGTPPAAKKR
ncbi:MAG TPA: hypothetical protein VFA56_04420 [Gaiellaceae bacterium]|nr:hypothetical protein [Gaiellaceae bacterium]